jgi:hypothetical protein
VRDFPQKLQLEVGKMKPELSFPVRGRSENDPSTPEPVSQPPRGRPSPSIFQGTFCAAKQSISRIRCPSETHFVHPLSFKNTLRARLPSKSESGRCESGAFVRAFPQNLKVEDVNTKLS